MSGIGEPTPLPNIIGNDGERTLHAVFVRETLAWRLEVVHRVFRDRHTVQFVEVRPGYEPLVIAVSQVGELIETLVEIQSSIREARAR